MSEESRERDAEVMRAIWEHRKDRAGADDDFPRSLREKILSCEEEIFYIIGDDSDKAWKIVKYLLEVLV